MKTVTEKYFHVQCHIIHDMQKLFNNVNFTLVEHLLNLLISMSVRTKRFLIFSSDVMGAGKNGPGKNGPGKNGPGKNGPEKRSGKNGPGEKRSFR